MDSEIVNIEILSPEAAPLGQEANTHLALAAAVTITDAESYTRAAEERKALRAFDKRVEEFFKPMREAAHKAWKAVCAQEDVVRKPLVPALRTYDGKLAAWDDEQKRVQREEEAKRLAAARQAEENSRLAQAASLEDAGEDEMASAVLDAPVVPFAAPRPAPAVPKVEGLSYRTTYKAVVFDVAALIQHVAAHPELVNLLTPNTAALNSMARAQRQAFALPGVRVVEEKTLAQRSA
jgi:hypothetical protein